jgi:hypothetical protein
MPDLATAVRTHLSQTKVVLAVALDKSCELLLDEMKLLTARIDHDLNQLREMGHPYRVTAEQGFPHPDWIVHNQSAGLQEGLKKIPATVLGNQIEAEIISEAYYTWFLLLGTRYMRPRDFVSAAIINREKEVEALIERAWFAVHDGANQPGNSVSVNLILHDLYPAQLPDRV